MTKRNISNASLKFYIFLFVVLLTGVSVYWSFSYMVQYNRILYGHVMWGLFVFNVVGILAIGGMGFHEYIELFFHRKKLRTLERAHKTAEISQLNATAQLTLSKSTQPLLVEQPVHETPQSRVIVDLSDAIKIPKQYPLIQTIENFSRILVVGGQGSGKTATMLWLAYVKNKSTNVVAIDTHAEPNKWPRGVYVLGFGLNYEKAQSGFDAVIKRMEQRYQQIGNGLVGERSHPVITLLSDEWSMLPDMIPKFTDNYVKPLFTLARKASVDLSLAAHDETAPVLGMSGMAKFKRSFEAVVYCENVDGQFLTTVQFGYGTKTAPNNIMCYPPGPFIEGGQPMVPPHMHVDFETVPGILRDDIRILEAMRDCYDPNLGAVWNQKIRKQLDIPANSDGYKIIDNVAKKYNIKTM